MSSLNNFIDALKRRVDNPTNVSEVTRQKRLQTCFKCEYLVDSVFCSHKDCGCFLPEKAKWATEDCPVCRNCGKSKKEHKTDEEFISKWGNYELNVVSNDIKKCCG